MTNRTYAVDGMTCEHCVQAVTAELSNVPGVTDVAVDLPGGTVTVTGQAVTDDAVRAAVDEAGYTVVA